MNMKLFTIMLLVVPLNAGCNSGKKVEAQSRAAKPEAVKTQPTMFEWRGIHDGMTVAEFQAKDGKNCAEGRSNYACVNTEVDKDQSLVALFHHGLLYSFRIFCDGNPAANREYQDGCKPILAAIKAHFGKPVSDNVKYGRRAIIWKSDLELLMYSADAPYPEGEGVGTVEVCTPLLSGPRECHPD